MRFERYGNKYNNVKQNYNGSRYDSKKEATYAKELDLRIAAKDIKEYTRQFPLELRVNGKLICKWKIDFAVKNMDDSITFIEVKGFETYDYILKRKLFEALQQEMFPGSELIIIK